MSNDCQNPMLSGTKKWLEQTKAEATVLSEAYRLRLIGRLWWANLFLVVLPATLATAAAVFAAQGASRGNNGNGAAPSLLAAWLAGAAAVLTAAHRSLKCEEYQTECLRLSQEYKRMAISADFLLSTELQPPEEKLTTLIRDYGLLTASVKALIPKGFICKAQRITGYKLCPQPDGEPCPDDATHRLPAPVQPESAK